MRLGDLDELEKLILSYYELARSGDWVLREEIKDFFDNTPTIDQVKHGKWLIRDNPGTGWYQVTCSECGEDVTSTVPVIGFFPNAKVIWDFCPWCGSRMDL